MVIEFMSSDDLSSFGLIKLVVLCLEFLGMEDGQRGGITICNQSSTKSQNEKETTHYHATPVPSLRGMHCVD